jgi:methylmalonyl-CoA mutase cobalamin-binding subunit
MSQAIFPAKLSTETHLLTFDFSNDLPAAVTISTQVVTAAVYSGVDASPSSLISGSASDSAQIVTQLVTGGVSGTTYLLTCTITTSDSQTHAKQGFLTIIPSTGI